MFELLKSKFKSSEPVEFNYKLSRFFFCVIYAIALLFTNHVEEWALFDIEVYKPISAFALFGPQLHHWLSYNVLLVIRIGTVVLLSLFSLIYGSRWISALLLIGFYITCGYRNNFNSLAHEHCLSMITIMILVASDWALSLKSQASFVFIWATSSIRLVVVTAFTLAGLSKLTLSGIDWLSAENLQALFLVRKQPAALWLTDHPFILIGAATVALGIELFSAVGLYLRGYWVLVFPSLWCLFHLMVYIFLSPNFFYFTPNYLFWVPWWSFLKDKSSPPIPFSFSFKNKWLSSLTLTLCITLMACEIFKIQPWPFTHLPMFAKPFARKKIHQVYLYIVLKNNEEIKLPQKYLFPLEKKLKMKFLNNVFLKSNMDQKTAFRSLQKIICKNRTDDLSKPLKLKAIVKTWNDEKAFQSNTFEKKLIGTYEINCVTSDSYP